LGEESQATNEEGRSRERKRLKKEKKGDFSEKEKRGFGGVGKDYRGQT